MRGRKSVVEEEEEEESFFKILFRNSEYKRGKRPSILLISLYIIYQDQLCNRLILQLGNHMNKNVVINHKCNNIMYFLKFYCFHILSKEK